MPPIIVLQHAANEPLGMIEDALSASGLPFRSCRTYAGDAVPPDIGGAAGLVVLGDSMEFLGFKTGIRFRRRRAADPSGRRPGSAGAGRLPRGAASAAALGAAVGPNTKQEIGWHPVAMTAEAAEDPLWRGLAETWTGFHWHGDFFKTPPGAVSLAASELTPCQAFRFG